MNFAKFLRTTLDCFLPFFNILFCRNIFLVWLVKTRFPRFNQFMKSRRFFVSNADSFDQYIHIFFFSHYFLYFVVVAIFTWKHLCRSLFLINFVIKRLHHRCFPVNIAKFSRTTFLKNICEWQLLFMHCILLLFRAVGSFFMVGWLSKNVGHRDWPTTKNKKKTWLKCLTAVPQKTKFGLQLFFKISSLEFFFFFENITAGTQLSYIRLHVPVIIRFFLISDLPADNLKANKS